MLNFLVNVLTVTALADRSARSSLCDTFTVFLETTMIIGSIIGGQTTKRTTGKNDGQRKRR